MGWVGIDPSATARCKLLSLEMGWARPLDGVGCMAAIWGLSQELGIELATRAQLLLWGEIPAADAERFIEVLTSEEIRFVTKVGQRYRIHGNRRALERIKAQREKSQKGGKASAEARGCGKHEESEPEVQPVEQPKVERQDAPVVEPELQPTSTVTITSKKHETNTPQPPEAGGGGSEGEIDLGIPLGGRKHADAIASVAASECRKHVFCRGSPADDGALRGKLSRETLAAVDLCEPFNGCLMLRREFQEFGAAVLEQAGGGYGDEPTPSRAELETAFENKLHRRFQKRLRVEWERQKGSKGT